RIRVRFDGDETLEVELGPASLEPEGQRVAFPEKSFRRLEVELVATTAPPFDPALANAVGFAEVSVADVAVDEMVRLPVDLARLPVALVEEAPLHVILTRLRVSEEIEGRQDEELALNRRFELPARRSFRMSGTARTNGAPGDVGGCRLDLITIDNRPVGIELTPRSLAAGALDVSTCGGSELDLDAGSHRVKAQRGLDTGFDIDRLVLSAGADGPASAGRGSPRHTRVVKSSPTAIDVELSAGGEPFWLVLGQSNSAGWEASVTGGDAEVGPNELVDGYANGWLVTPREAGEVTIALRWRPQRLVWVGLVLSAIAIAASLAIVVRTQGASGRDTGEIASRPVLALAPGRRRDARSAALGAVVLGGLFALVSTAWIGVAVAAILGVLSGVPRARLGAAAAASGALAAAVMADRPALAWLALGVAAAAVYADVSPGALRAGGSPPRTPPSPEPAPRS
ncbi:MAG: hypothetical protein ACLGHT_08365, partial [Acidimicrobiia bacterium]